LADQNVSVTDFEEGARRALEWLGRSEDAAELAQIVGEMPAKLGDMEIAFLIAIARAALAGHKAAPQTRTKQRHGQLRCHHRRRPPQCHGSTSTSSVGGG
jgi:hypothetical protein